MLKVDHIGKGDASKSVFVLRSRKGSTIPPKEEGGFRFFLKSQIVVDIGLPFFIFSPFFVFRPVAFPNTPTCVRS